MGNSMLVVVERRYVSMQSLLNEKKIIFIFVTSPVKSSSNANSSNSHQTVYRELKYRCHSLWGRTLYATVVL